MTCPPKQIKVTAQVKMIDYRQVEFTSIGGVFSKEDEKEARRLARLEFGDCDEVEVNLDWRAI